MTRQEIGEFMAKLKTLCNDGPTMILWDVANYAIGRIVNRTLP